MAMQLCVPQSAFAKAVLPSEIASGFFDLNPKIDTEFHVAKSLSLSQENVLCFYDVASGRRVWLSPDPIQEAGGLNLYGYVGGNVVNDTDELGLLPVLIPLRAVVMVARKVVIGAAFGAAIGVGIDYGLQKVENALDGEPSKCIDKDSLKRAAGLGAIGGAVGGPLGGAAGNLKKGKTAARLAKKTHKRIRKKLDALKRNRHRNPDRLADDYSGRSQALKDLGGAIVGGVAGSIVKAAIDRLFPASDEDPATDCPTQ